MTIQDQIIDFIKRNRISTTEVADCLDKSGAIETVTPLNRGHFRVGKVHWAYAYNESNWECHEQLQDVDEGAVIVVDAFNCKGRALFGSLVTKYLFLYRQAAGLVVVGNMRDVPHLIKENWPIWLEGITPIGTFNVKNEEPMNQEAIREHERIYRDAIAVCDDSGVVIIPRDMQDREFLDKLAFIEEQEDIWFDCIDRRKWNTFETVCLKQYLEDE